MERYVHATFWISCIFQKLVLYEDKFEIKLLLFFDTPVNLLSVGSVVFEWVTNEIEPCSIY